METIENYLTYDLIDFLKLLPAIEGYGMSGSIKGEIDDCIYADKSENGVPISSLIKILRDNSNTNLLNAIMNFYYSYHCKFDKPVALNARVRENHSIYGYENSQSAAARARKLKSDMQQSPVELYQYFRCAFENMQKGRKGTLPPYDADIIIQSTLSFYDSPYYMRDNYTTKHLQEFVQKFERILNRKDDVQKHINSYLFERVYHIALIYIIVDFYHTFNTVIDEFAFDNKNQSFKYSGEGNKYFDVNIIKIELDKYIFKRNSTEKQTKDAYKRKCRDFALNLCEFAYISDVYTRTDMLKQFIKNNIQYILYENRYINKLRSIVSRAAREAIVYNKVFYYSSIYWSVMRNQQTEENKNGEEGIDTVWQDILSGNQSKDFLDFDLQGIEAELNNSVFGLPIMELSKQFPDCDDIINDLFQKILFELQIFKSNRQIVCYPFNDSDFDKKYIELVKEALDSPLKVYQERSNQ